MGEGDRLSWADVVPGWSEAVPGWPPDAAGWPDDVTEDTPLPVSHRSSGAPAASAGEDRAPWHAGDTPLRRAAGVAEVPQPSPPGLSAAGAFDGGSRAAIFDPGWRGVRALVVVAVVVVLVAAFLAWRGRPEVTPVAPPLGEVSGVAASGSGAPGSGAPGGGAAGTGASGARVDVVVAVGGKVRKPGLVRLGADARVADALVAAGGAQPGVDVAPLNLARKVVDGELIMVGASLPPGAGAAPPPVGAASQPGAPVNLNTATLAELDTLPGVGPVLAQRILDAREARGGFRAVTDLRQVEGIGAARYDQLKDLVTV